MSGHFGLEDGGSVAVQPTGSNAFRMYQTGGGLAGPGSPTLVYYNWDSSQDGVVITDQTGIGTQGHMTSAPAVAGSTVAVRWSDGNIWFKDFFFGFDDDQLHWQECPHGGVLDSAPAICYAGETLHVFASGKNSQLWHAYRSADGKWIGGWWPIIGLPNSVKIAPEAAPSVASPNPQRIDVFVLGTDQAVYHLVVANLWGPYWYAAPPGWESLGGTLTSPPTSFWLKGILNVFAVGPDGQLATNYLEPKAPWNGWGSPPGAVMPNLGAPPLEFISQLSFPVVVVPPGTDEPIFDIFARAGYAELWNLRWVPSTGYQGWKRIQIEQKAGT
jgi:hypothetical protein